MRCLIVANVFPPMLGGSATVYESLALFSAGQVSVLAPSDDYTTGRPIPGVAAYDAASPLRIHRLHRLRTLITSQTSLVWRARTALEDVWLRARLLLTIRRIARDEGITAICVGELISNGWVAGAARRWLGLFTAIYVHGEEITTADVYDARGRRRRAALAGASRIITVSAFSRDALITQMGVDPSRITLIPNGVDLSRFSPRPPDPSLQARYGLAGRRVLLSVCRLTARKGVDQVIECLPALRAQFPDLVYLVVGDGHQAAALKARVTALGLDNTVVFAGAVDAAELADHYALADIFILPNRTLANGETEGFGIVFLEASACGIPVIAGRAGGSVDAVKEGVSGLFVDGTAQSEITAAVTKLLTDLALHATLSAGGLLVAADSRWEHRAARFLAACTPDTPPPGAA
jgi:phosphatidylinositol alpha-1,6-mannosyltransferase